LFCLFQLFSTQKGNVIVREITREVLEEVSGSFKEIEVDKEDTKEGSEDICKLAGQNGDGFLFFVL